LSIAEGLLQPKQNVTRVAMGGIATTVVFLSWLALKNDYASAPN